MTNPWTQIQEQMKKPTTSGSDESRPILTQVGGDHYKKLKIQPVEYAYHNGLGYFEGSVIKYVTRWRDKNGLEDLKKALHFLELLIEFETNEQAKKSDSERPSYT